MISNHLAGYLTALRRRTCSNSFVPVKKSSLDTKYYLRRAGSFHSSLCVDGRICEVSKQFFSCQWICWKPSSSRTIGAFADDLVCCRTAAEPWKMCLNDYLPAMLPILACTLSFSFWRVLYSTSHTIWCVVPQVACKGNDKDMAPRWGVSSWCLWRSMYNVRTEKTNWRVHHWEISFSLKKVFLMMWLLICIGFESKREFYSLAFSRSSSQTCFWSCVQGFIHSKKKSSPSTLSLFTRKTPPPFKYESHTKRV